MDNLIFAYGSTENQWLGQLVDVTNPLTPIPHDLTGWSKVYIVFKKPDGTQWPTDQQMLDEYEQGAIVEDATTPGGPVNLANANIKFLDNTLPSILDQRGAWEYVPVAKIGNSLKKSPFPVLFWVA
jgi:hypothetical protein